MNKLALISLALVSATAFAAKPHIYKGWVGDSNCGVKSASAAHMACAVKCLNGGAKYIFVLDKDKKTIYQIDNPTALKGNEGLLVQVTAELNGTTLHIDGVKKLKQPGAAAQTGEHGGM